jgi:RHS repeat-associated protein
MQEPQKPQYALSPPAGRNVNHLTTAAVGLNPTVYRFSGKEMDEETGFYYYGYRDYRPQAARFTTVDPIRDGSNWYAYVNNDPVNWVDLWGLEGYSYQVSRTYRVYTNRGVAPTYYEVVHSAIYYSSDRVLLTNFQNDQRDGRVNVPWSQANGEPQGQGAIYSPINRSSNVSSEIDDHLYINKDIVEYYYVDGKETERNSIKDNGSWCRNPW